MSFCSLLGWDMIWEETLCPGACWFGKQPVCLLSSELQSLFWPFKIIGMTDTWLSEPENGCDVLPESILSLEGHVENNSKRHKSCTSEPRNKWNEIFLLKLNPSRNKSDKNKYQNNLTYIWNPKKKKIKKQNSCREETLFARVGASGEKWLKVIKGINFQL